MAYFTISTARLTYATSLDRCREASLHGDDDDTGHQLDCIRYSDVTRMNRINKQTYIAGRFNAGDHLFRLDYLCICPIKSDQTGSSACLCIVSQPVRFLFALIADGSSTI